MTIRKLFIFLSFILVLVGVMGACDKNEPTDGNSNEIVFFNGKVYTVNPAKPWAEAIYVKDGVIKYVGTTVEAKSMATADAELIDLEGGMMMPGIHDVHTHPLEASTDNFHFTVSEDEMDAENYASVIAQANTANPGTGWLLGWGHPFETLVNATRSPRLIIDDVVSNRPVAIMEQTSHSVWVNTKALEVMGYTAATANPKGGIIMREANGTPNGLLLDNAGELVFDKALVTTVEKAQKDYDGLVNFGLEELAKNGITSICEARTFWKRNQQEVWKKIENDGKLTCRVNLGLWAYPADNDAAQIASIKALYRNDPSKLLRINQIKVYADGIIHNTTAAMQSSYLIDYFNLPTNKGLNYFDEARLAQFIAALEGTGFDFHIHALGNRGVHEGLNAIAQSGTAAGRHRLTHVEYIDAADIGRFAQLNVTADAQVAGDFTQPGHWHENDYLIGSALNNANIPLKSLRDAGARLTLSSDWDVSSINPFVGMKNAVTRSPQNISLEEAVKAYTINAAYTMRQETRVGSIEVGKEADLILLDRNIFEIPAAQIGDTQVELTYLKGKVVYEK